MDAALKILLLHVPKFWHILSFCFSHLFQFVLHILAQQKLFECTFHDINVSSPQNLSLPWILYDGKKLSLSQFYPYNLILIIDDFCLNLLGNSK